MVINHWLIISSDASASIKLNCLNWRLVCCEGVWHNSMVSLNHFELTADALKWASYYRTSLQHTVSCSLHIESSTRHS